MASYFDGVLDYIRCHVSTYGKIKYWYYTKVDEFVKKELQVQNMSDVTAEIIDTYTKTHTTESDLPVTWDYIRGLFDTCGFIDIDTVQCSLVMPDNAFYIHKITEFIKIPYVESVCNTFQSMGSPYVRKPSSLITMWNYQDTSPKGSFKVITFSGVNCIDFLGSIYSNLNGHVDGREIMSIYYELIDPDMKRDTHNVAQKFKNTCDVWKVDDAAVFPTKARPSDVGYDLTIIKEVKKLTNNVTLYDTGIKVQVGHGLYTEIVPRSSLSKSGYMLANSVGIIDPSYTGNIMVALAKINPNAPEIQLPFRCCQLIFRKQVYVNMNEVTDGRSINDTLRSEGGFGSSG